MIVVVAFLGFSFLCLQLSPIGLDVFQNLIESLTIKSITIDDAFILQKTKHARFFIPWLCSQGDGSNFYSPKTKLHQRLNDFSVLVESSCQANRIRKYEREFVKDRLLYVQGLLCSTGTMFGGPSRLGNENGSFVCL